MSSSDKHSQDFLQHEVTELNQRVSRLERLLLPDTSSLAQQQAMFSLPLMTSIPTLPQRLG